MLPILKLFWGICILQTGPEQVPSVKPFAAMVALVFAGFNIALWVTLYDRPFLESLGSVMIWLTGIAAVLYSSLSFKGLVNRFWPAYTAIIGQDVVITLCSLPFQVLFVTNMNDQTVAAFANGALLFFYGWSLVVVGFILQRALNLSYFLGLAMSFALLLSISWVDYSVFGMEELAADGAETSISETIRE